MSNNMIRSFIILFLFTFLGSTKCGAAVQDEGQRCKKNNTVIAQEGRKTDLIVDMIFGDRCYFLFTTKDNSYQCCYDDGLNNYCQTSQKYKHGDDTKCLNQDQYSLRNDPTETQTCVLTIESVSEADSGHYISFNADHKELQACNLAFVKTESITSAGTIPLVVGLLALLLVFAVVVFLCVWVFKSQRQKLQQYLPCSP